jgi:DHA2 family multidrug resistance protein
MGPTLGGWLTETYNWRWVFYINLPFGLLAAAGLMVFLPGGGGQGRLRFDWLGFSVLAIGIGGLQLMLILVANSAAAGRNFDSRRNLHEQ